MQYNITQLQSMRMSDVKPHLRTHLRPTQLRPHDPEHELEWTIVAESIEDDELCRLRELHAPRFGSVFNGFRLILRHFQA